MKPIKKIIISKTETVNVSPAHFQETDTGEVRLIQVETLDGRVIERREKIKKRVFIEAKTEQVTTDHQRWQVEDSQGEFHNFATKVDAVLFREGK